MKKIISLTIVVLTFALCLTGCGKKIDRLNYVKGVEKYTELCDLANITVDCNSEDYASIEKSLLDADFSTYTQEVKSGNVEKNDIANIDYEGKIDGVAFEGGTAEGYDLTIGSGTFIDGFEDQLIGVELGKTVDINVTFPTDYQSTDLAGKAAVFTVTINKIARPYAEVNDEFAKAAGFENAEAYNKDLKDRTVKNFVYDYVIDNSKVNELPPDKDGNNYSYYKDYYTQLATSYGTTFKDLLSNYQMSEGDFKNEMLRDEIICYGIFDKLGLTITKEAVNEMAEETASLNGVTAEDVINNYGENFVEFIYVNNAITEKLAETAKVIDKN